MDKEMQIRLIKFSCILKIIIFALVLILMAITNVASASDIDTTGCEEVKVDCALPNQKRNIRGTDVHRNCWKYTYKLDCSKLCSFHN